MKKYELVVVLDARTPQEVKNTAMETIETTLGEWSVLKKDEIGAMEAAYDFSQKRGNNKIYIVSYYCQLDPSKVKGIREELQYIKGLVRSFFYTMGAEQPFFTYKELQEYFEEQEEKEIAEKENQEEKKEEQE